MFLDFFDYKTNYKRVKYYNLKHNQYEHWTVLLLLRLILTQLLRSNIKTYENKSELPKKKCYVVCLMRQKKQKKTNPLKLY